MHAANTASALLNAIWLAARGEAATLERVTFTGHGELPSVFAVTDLAAASVGAAGLALSSLMDAMNERLTTGGRHTADAERAEANTVALARHPASVMVDRRLASGWFGYSLRPEGWQPADTKDQVMGDHRAQDGWVRLHTNAPHHLAAALRALSLDAQCTREDVTRAVATWQADALEAKVLAENGCAATMRSWKAWQQHPQGQAVLSEPLLHWQAGTLRRDPGWSFNGSRPLQGLKVLDMTRVLAGPAATRLLAGLGAEVLRIDPPWWDEPTLAPEMTLGKRCARIDLRTQSGQAQWRALLSQADIFVHGYRSDALSSLGWDALARQALRPGLVDISLDAYGFSGPWNQRRGFDSLVQMSMGIAYAGQQLTNASEPTPLPVQALDHATGYILATAALRGLETRLKTGHGSIARASLARTAALLMTTQKPQGTLGEALAPESAADLAPTIEQTYWGSARRLRWPVQVTGVNMQWDVPAGPLGSAKPVWLS